MYCFVKFMRACVCIRAYECACAHTCMRLCVRVVRVRAVYPIILPHFKPIFIKY